jgi:hypothetical protein
MVKGFKVLGWVNAIWLGETRPKPAKEQASKK